MENDNYAEIEFAIVIDADGDYHIGKDTDEAIERYNDEVGGDGIRQAITIKLKVPLPKAIEVSGTLPRKDDGSYSLAIQS